LHFQTNCLFNNSSRKYGIDRSLNGMAVESDELWLADAQSSRECSIGAGGPRVGVDYASEEDQQKPWRFTLKRA
jgi:3-methyladenine DNA glycosylase Mpg